jgi:drug/metabolite transporter (DMT)-like permease
MDLLDQVMLEPPPAVPTAAGADRGQCGGVARVSRMTPVAVALALLAGGCIAVSWALQHQAATREQRHEILDPRLLVRLLRRPRWLAGRAAAVIGVVLQAFALRHGPLSVVSPLMVVGPVFAVPLSARLDRRPLVPGTVAAVLAAAIGLAVFLVGVAPLAGTHGPSQTAWAGIGSAAALAVVACLLATPAARPELRAALLGTATGVLFGVAAALLKAVGDQGAGSLFLEWQSYGWLVVSGIALTLNQNAFQQGSLAAALTAMTLSEPLTSLLIGCLGFGERPLLGGVRVPVAVVGAITMAMGVRKLAQRARPAY